MGIEYTIQKERFNNLGKCKMGIGLFVLFKTWQGFSAVETMAQADFLKHLLGRPWERSWS